MSLSSRRAWIEMQNVYGAVYDKSVALLTESVDRNKLMQAETAQPVVALLTESVDRNVIHTLGV